jgi:hypothetical protein
MYTHHHYSVMGWSAHVSRSKFGAALPFRLRILHTYVGSPTEPQHRIE